MIQHVIQVSKWQNALPDALKGINFAWLEITKKCPLECKHCYVASSPRLSHGVMQADDWKHTMDQLKDLGCKAVQFIGGEPSIHPSFCDLLAHAAQLGFSVEVYSNLVGITSRMWSLFVEHKIKLACSFYSDQPSIHDQITKTPGSFQRTFANIEKALSLGLTLRVGKIGRASCRERVYI